jgi:hypothetical protein
MIAFDAPIDKQRHQRPLWFILPWFLAAGCVSLTKPSEVEKCSSTGTCSDDAGKTPGADAKKDVVTPVADAGRDGTSDSIEAGTDSIAMNPDVATPDLSKEVPAAGPDGPDAGPDLLPGAEPGPEPLGAEPSAQKEPGPEPVSPAEPGPEPTSSTEPRPEPGPEPAPEPPPDASVPDASTAACANATPVTGGSVVFNTTGPFCFVTCDGMEWGWGCSSFGTPDGGSAAERTVTVNGVSVTCGGPLPAKKTDGYYYFEVGRGGDPWDQIHYSGTAAKSCPTPAGGFSP